MNSITITKNTITYKHQIIKVANISSVDLKEYKEGNSSFLIWLGIIFLFVAIFNLDIIGLAAVMFILSIFFFYLNYDSKKSSHKYFLVVNTNSGSGELFSHKEYEFINSIRLKILDALNDVGDNFSVTYNIDNKTVINNPTGNITITNVTNYTGLSEEDKQFITNSFEPALQQIKSEIEGLKDDELSRNLEMILNEMKLEKPRKPIIQSAWEAISVVSNLAEAVNNVTRGINMFS